MLSGTILVDKNFFKRSYEWIILTINLGGESIRIGGSGSELRRDGVPRLGPVPENGATEDELLPRAPPSTGRRHHRHPKTAAVSAAHVYGNQR
ncbi:hypothetical protein U1Q18_010739, partial [Sarracenia purpurea var. burkii]